MVHLKYCGKHGLLYGAAVGFRIMYRNRNVHDWFIGLCTMQIFSTSWVCAYNRCVGRSFIGYIARSINRQIASVIILSYDSIIDGARSILPPISRSLTLVFFPCYHVGFPTYVFNRDNIMYILITNRYRKVFYRPLTRNN